MTAATLPGENLCRAVRRAHLNVFQIACWSRLPLGPASPLPLPLGPASPTVLSPSPPGAGFALRKRERSFSTLWCSFSR